MSMLDQVAKASHDFFRTQYTLLPPWDELPPEAQNLGRQHVAAILTAMRDPTESMTIAGGEQIDFDEFSPDATQFMRRQATYCWNRMIDAGLAGK